MKGNAMFSVCWTLDDGSKEFEVVNSRDAADELITELINERNVDENEIVLAEVIID